MVLIGNLKYASIGHRMLPQMMLESGNPVSSNTLEPVKDAAVIDIERLQVSLRKKLGQTAPWNAFDEQFTLSRLPPIVCESHKDHYEPQVVSIGPYHHRGRSCLSAMEAHKPRCLLKFLDRNPAVGLEVYIERIGELEQRARRCYTEDISLSKDEFVEMLLLDGCFLLEFFFRVRARKPHILLDVGWGTQTVITDLLLYENQIPFFIVETLYSIVTNDEGNRESLLFLLEPSSTSPDLEARGTIFHLLHLYYQWFVPGRIVRSRRSYSNSPSSNLRISTESSQSRQSLLRLRTKSIPCATDLYEAGVAFRRKEYPSDMFDITFENGVMEIPTLQIDSFWKVFYLNVAAFEWSCSTTILGCDLMSYIALMNSLINTNKDVVLLKRCGILSNMLLHQEELAVFFSRLGDWSVDLDSDKHYFASLFSMVQCYYNNSRWPRYRARLMHDYFNSPWSTLSVIAAVFLLVLSALQAIYGMYPYVHHH